MDLTIGSRGEYALRLALELARRWPGGRVKGRALAELADVPVPYAAHVLGDLVRTGIAASVSGPTGGYEIASDPSGISLLDVLEAAGVALVPTRCPLTGGSCTPEAPCTVHVPWRDARLALAAQLSRTDLAALVGQENGAPS